MRPLTDVRHARSEQRCIEYADAPDPGLRDRIIEEHQWLVEVCANQMRRRGEHFEDLVQVGNIGLMQALDRFDPTFGVTFRTYASASILGVLRRHYRSIWRVHVPRRMQELNLSVSRAVETLTSELRRSPTIADIATHLHVSVEDVLEAMEAGQSYWPGHLIPDGEGDPGPAVVGDATDEMALADDRSEVRKLLATLAPRSRAILYMRFFEELTQSEIAARLDLSQVHVSRLMRSALTELRLSATHTADPSPGRIAGRVGDHANEMRAG